MMDMMGIIGHLTVYTGQEISAEDRRGSGLGALQVIVGWMVGCGCCIYV